MEQEKDNFWLYVGGVIALAIVLVVGMRMTRDDLEKGVKDPSAQAEAQAEINKTLERIHSQK